MQEHNDYLRATRAQRSVAHQRPNWISLFINFFIWLNCRNPPCSIVIFHFYPCRLFYFIFVLIVWFHFDYWSNPLTPASIFIHVYFMYIRFWTKISTNLHTRLNMTWILICTKHRKRLRKSNKHILLIITFYD